MDTRHTRRGVLTAGGTLVAGCLGGSGGFGPYDAGGGSDNAERSDDQPSPDTAAIDGPLEAASLRPVPVFWSTWETWRSAYPDSVVLTEDTGHARSYGDDPYGEYNPTSGYYAEDEGPIFDPLETDDWRLPKAMVLGARPPEGPVAIDPDRLAADGVVTFDLGETTLLAVCDDRIDTGHLYRNPDERSFAFDSDVPADEEPVTDGDGDSYTPDELPLEPVYSYDAMWFAWAGFYPSTETVE